MSVTVTRLDGQNVGLRLLGQVSVNVLSLDLTSGAVQSDFFSTEDCRVLQQFATALFQIVPVSARSAASIGLLTRLCSVSPADASTLTLTSTVSRGVATLSATVAVSPASLILTIPFSPNGGIVPGMMTSNASGGGGGGADSTVILPYSGTLDLGDAVVRNAATGRVRRADPWSETLMPAIGIVVRWDESGDPVIQTDGIVTGLYGSGTAPLLFVGEGGRLVPISDGLPRVQMMGYWLDSTKFKLNIDPRVLVRG
jgi:hypothetical protein